MPFVSIRSHTTVDARIAYDFGKRAGLLSGLTLAVSAQNLFNRDPPSTAIVLVDRDMGFDGTNANPLGRLIAVELVKTW